MKPIKTQSNIDYLDAIIRICFKNIKDLDMLIAECLPVFYPVHFEGTSITFPEENYYYVVTR